MAFHCPSCTGETTLVLVNSAEMPTDAVRTELTLQLLECRQCGFLAAAIYEDRTDGPIRHRGHALGEADWTAMRDAMLARPNHGPREVTVDPALGSVEHGSWRPPAAIDTPGFPIELPDKRHR